MKWLEDASILSYIPPAVVKLRDSSTGSPRHVFVFGMTGSGKTSSVKRLVQSRWLRRPVLILDWGGEYGDLGFKEVRPEEVSMEGLRPIDVVDALGMAYQLTKPQEAFLLRCLKDTLKLREVVEKVESYPIKSAVEVEVREALLRRLEALRSLSLFEGDVGLKELMDRSTALNLSHLPYEARRLTVNILLRMIYNAVPTVNPKGAIIVLEEAENIVPARRLEGLPSGGEVILNELRKWGVSVIAIAQLPSQVSPSAFRNCEYILIHRALLTPLEASWLGLKEEEVHRLSRLNTGELLFIHRGSKRWLKVPLSNYAYVRSSAGNSQVKAGRRRDLADLELVEGRLELVEEKLKSIEDELEDIKSFTSLLPLLAVSRRAGLIIVEERERLGAEKASLVSKALRWLGDVEEVAVNGRRCWFVRTRG